MSYTAAMLPSGVVSYTESVPNSGSTIDDAGQCALLDSMASTCGWSRGSGFKATGQIAIAFNPSGSLTGAQGSAGVYDGLTFIVYGPLNVPLIIPSGPGIVAVPGGSSGNATCSNVASAIQANTQFNCTYAQVGSINGTGALTLVAKSSGYSSNWSVGNLIPEGGGWDYTSVPTPGLGDTVTMLVKGYNGGVRLTPILGGNSCAEQNPMNARAPVSFWMNKYTFWTMRSPSRGFDNGNATFLVSALYVPPELRTTSITSSSFFYIGGSTQAVPGGVGVYVNGHFKTDPWGAHSIFFVCMQMPVIFASSLMGQLTTTRQRPIQHTPFVALAYAPDTEAKMAGILMDSFIALSNTESANALATGPDGRTYRRWDGANSIGGAGLWWAIR